MLWLGAIFSEANHTHFRKSLIIIVSFHNILICCISFDNSSVAFSVTHTHNTHRQMPAIERCVRPMIGPILDAIEKFPSHKRDK